MGEPMSAWAWILIGVAVALVPAGDRVGAPRRRSADDPDPALPLVLDLLAAALRAGRPVADAVELAAAAARAETADALARVARLLRLGADPAAAWQAIAAPDRAGVAALIPVAIRSAVSGAKLAAAAQRLAAELRADRRAAAAARAQRAGVFAMAPLAACFLPSFVCLGIVPTVVGVAAGALGHPP